MSEVRTWIVQQCNVYGACNMRQVRFEQEFGRDAETAQIELAEFCRASRLNVEFVPEKALYVFKKAD